MNECYDWKSPINDNVKHAWMNVMTSKCPINDCVQCHARMNVMIWKGPINDSVGYWPGYSGPSKKNMKVKVI